MKLSTLITTLLLTASVSARNSLFSPAQRVLEDAPTPVPGNNPLTYCTTETSSYILNIKTADIDPNPPQA